MKCPRCNGKRCEPDNSGDLVWRACKMCNGTGIVPDNNENWFCRLPTKEKAKEMCVIMADMAEANDGVWDEEMIEAWLKEEHHE